MGRGGGHRTDPQGEESMNGALTQDRVGMGGGVAPSRARVARHTASQEGGSPRRGSSRWYSELPVVLRMWVLGISTPQAGGLGEGLGEAAGSPHQGTEGNGWPLPWPSRALHSLLAFWTQTQYVFPSPGLLTLSACGSCFQGHGP